jgi:hypothetical protein
MARHYIEHFHLSPSVLIINENHFFTSGLSPYGDETIKMGYWQALTRIVEHDISWFLRVQSHQFFPRFGLGKIYGSVPVVEYRSIQTGCLVMENFKEDLVPAAVRDSGEEVLSVEELQTAVKFKKEMEARGIKIILTSVPYGTDEMKDLGRWIKDPEERMLVSGAEEPYEKVDLAAKRLKIPLIEIGSKDLETFDGRHLDEKSGLAFTRLFFDQFLKRPEVKTLLKAKMLGKGEKHEN